MTMNYEELVSKVGEENVHCCNICGKPLEWDDNIWINSNFGVCEDCYNKIPQRIQDKIEEELYEEEEVKNYLDSVGAIY